MRWFRLYTEARNDAKLRRLTGDQFRVWFNLLCYAAEQPRRGSIEGKSDELLSIEVADGNTPLLHETLKRLVTLHCVTWCVSSGVISFHNFEKRQFHGQPASSTERVRKHRLAKKLRQELAAGETAKRTKRSVKRAETPDTDTDTDTEGKPLSPPTAEAPPLPPQPPPPPGWDDLEVWAREVLGDVFDLHSFGPALRSWRGTFPEDRIRHAILKSVAARKATPAYAFGCLRAPDRAPADPDAPPPSKAQAAVDAMRRYVEAEASRNGEGVAHGRG